MTDPNKLYESYHREGSYFNLMLNCGHNYNQWVQNALRYLPQDIFDEHKENLVFLTTADIDGCRVARHYCENREVILLSERILPKQYANAGQSERILPKQINDAGQPDVRYFIYVVLHEVAHAIKKHKSPKFDKLTREEDQAQEDEADRLALEWFNQHIEDNPNLKPLTKEDVELEQKKQLIVREQLYTGVLRDCSKCEFDFKEAAIEETDI